VEEEEPFRRIGYLSLHKFSLRMQSWPNVEVKAFPQWTVAAKLVSAIASAKLLCSLARFNHNSHFSSASSQSFWLNKSA